MKSKLITQLENVLPKDMRIPEELRLLYKWIEENNFYIDDENGKRIGFLYSPQMNLKGLLFDLLVMKKILGIGLMTIKIWNLKSDFVVLLPVQMVRCVVYGNQILMKSR
ncbi:hypothetical protein QJU23_03310 [Pasteurella atlantica]|uniref:Uncharacterized protein n=2 Tax=Pasteurellaceae TaxID=712 RepID=A0ACC6HKW2_9PAST|nr:hypothetical protein [Pasteurella atlantica]MDP8051453.1 hypothetical protein [Pasteurella atlantica]MDP8104667.1 hypothetical protein [Pasteurella atlantica]MDP8148111.1 hypothetical protein [Pasteurella atlantica]